MSNTERKAFKDKTGAAYAEQVIRHAEFAPPYPHNSPNETELDPLVVSYQSVSPPVVSAKDGSSIASLPRGGHPEQNNN